MKKMFSYFLFLLFAVSITAVAQEQVPPPADPIRLYDGIPIISQGLHYDWVVYNPGAVDTMKNQAGVDFIFRNTENINEMQVLTDSAQYPYRYGFKILPGKTLDYNYIQHYTNAKYSVWEAEGTPVEKGTQTLVYNTEKADTVNGSYITRKGNIPNSVDHLISEGPKYPNLWQDIRYYASQDGNCDTVPYTTEFRLMLEQNLNGTQVEYNPEDTLCIIQVTQSNLNFTCTYVIADSVITRGDFNNLNEFQVFNLLDYKLTSNECQGSAEFPDIIPPTVFEEVQCPGAISMRHNIEYKVIWMGKSNPEGYPAYLLSVDKITTSEERGRLLMDPESGAKQNIIAQADTLGQYNPYVAGFIGIDEPRSPDLYEPIRMVKEILDEHTQRERPLWLYFAGADFYKNNFTKRVGSANIIYNTFLYDYPCKPETACVGCPDGPGDYRDKNISWHANNIKAAYEIDPFFGLSVQCGAINPPYGPCNSLRNISSRELLNNINLGLMYGVKFFNLYTYFATSRLSDSIDTDYTYHAIVDWDPIQVTHYTDKFYTLRDIINHRLKGLLGKTIKKLTPTTDYLRVSPSANLNIGFIKGFLVQGDNPSPSPIFDIGFFSNSQSPDDKYCMLLNRYYSNINISDYKVTFKNLVGYNNWKYLDYRDTSGYTLVPDINGEALSNVVKITRGDAAFISLKPVVQAGGELLADDIAGDGMTLNDDMIIDNGASLSIYGNYYAKGDIIIKNGIIENYEDGKIIFQDGKKLIISGNATINGTANDKLTFDFTDPNNDNGIVIESGGSLNISYCKIQKAENGKSREWN